MTWRPDADPTVGGELGLPDRYRRVRLLGAGSEGTVWLAVDQVLGRDVAVKVLAPTASEEGVRRAARALRPGTVPVYDLIARPDGERCVVMPAVAGEDYRVWVEEVAARRRAGSDAAVALVPVATALAELHDAGLVYTDLSPANVRVLGPAGAVLLDMGTITPVGDVVGHRGTDGFGSPARAAGAPAASADDIHALGCLLLMLGAGLPRELRGLALACLDLGDPRRRRGWRVWRRVMQPTMREVAGVLDAWRAGGRLPWWVHDAAWGWLGRRILARYGVLLGSVMLVVTTAAGTVGWVRASQEVALDRSLRGLMLGTEDPAVAHALVGRSPWATAATRNAVRLMAGPLSAPRPERELDLRSPDDAAAWSALARGCAPVAEGALCVCDLGRLCWRVGAEVRDVAFDGDGAVMTMLASASGPVVVVSAEDALVRVRLVQLEPHPPFTARANVGLPMHSPRGHAAVGDEVWVAHPSGAWRWRPGDEPRDERIETGEVVAMGERGGDVWLALGSGAFVAWDDATQRFVTRTEGVATDRGHRAVPSHLVADTRGPWMWFGSDGWAGGTVMGVWDTVDRPPEVLSVDHINVAHAVALDDDCIAVADLRGGLRWVRRSLGGATVAYGEQPGVEGLAVVGGRLVTRSRDDAGLHHRVWTDGCGTGRYLPGSVGQRWFALRLSPDGRYLVGTGQLGALRVWSTETSEVVAATEAPSRVWEPAAWHPEGWLVVGDSLSGDLFGWDPWRAEAPREIASARRPGESPYELMWADDGRTLAGTGTSGSLQRWTLAAGSGPRPLTRVTDVRLGPSSTFGLLPWASGGWLVGEVSGQLHVVAGDTSTAITSGEARTWGQTLRVGGSVLVGERVTGDVMAWTDPGQPPRRWAQGKPGAWPMRGAAGGGLTAWVVWPDRLWVLGLDGEELGVVDGLPATPWDVAVGADGERVWVSVGMAGVMPLALSELER